ncbi:hypothetical protein FB451DRAFT_1164304 [Mycena latifolia]|nr:hypothetical protein FB451DRAFT_1164304 [Mycena latifolia]
MKRTKRKATGAPDHSGSYVMFRNPAVKRVHYTITTDTGSSSSTSTVGRILISQPLRPETLMPSPTQDEAQRLPVPEPEDGRGPNQTRTQNGQLLDDFGDHFDALGELLLEYEADEDTDLLCTSTCPSCFIKAHIQNPFHWAEVWLPLQGYFVRHDISKLGHIIQLGHKGRPCPSPVGERMFTVVDANGVHSTRLAFCGCQEQPANKIKQLMRAWLFPATTRDPHTAFTVNMLKQFQLHNLESKKAAYDYLGAIRRLSDNSFTADVQNPYAAFLRVVRVFNYLTLVKRCGQLLGIDALLPHRPAGNLLVWCPACPEPGVNSDPNCPETPAHLRHLNQSQRTLDGNHQCNQFSKNTDPDDVSLCAGKGYFPLDSKYQEYLQSVPKSTEVVNKQDKKKFKNMAITGTVLVTRFANSDYALAMALRNHKPGAGFEFKLQIEVDDIDEVSTYDIACEYLVNLESRFQKYFSDQVGSIKKMRWGVPALHVQGHQESCTYLFGTAYMECIGHFHGESAEHYWPEANQLGPHVRQMNLGHRQDTMINHHGDWNYKKMMKIAVDLAEDIQEAKEKYIEKRNHFIGLSISFKDRLSEWQNMPRTTVKEGKEVTSVYRHSTTKVPSQRAIYQKMLADEDNFASSLVPKSKIAKFLDRGLKIQDSQRKLKHLIRDTAEHELQARKKEISTRTTKLRDQISDFRQDQKHFMRNVGDKVAAQSTAAPAIEDERLFLPSELTEVERNQMGLTDLAREEERWREGQAFDYLRALQNAVKALSALRNRKTKNERQQKQNTRAGDHIEEAMKLQHRHMESYNIARLAIIALAGSTTFPPLTEADLFMKSVQQIRHVGDSKRTDGLLFRARALHSEGSHDDDGDIRMGEAEELDEENEQMVTGTQMDRRRSGPKPKRQGTGTKASRPERPEGWLWQLGKLTKMSNAEMDAWSNEGDRVQWFRAQAEMQRWQEQGEQKLVELLRTMRSFAKMHSVWAQLAEIQPSDRSGAKAYARQKVAMYERRRLEAQKKVQEAGYSHLLQSKANVLSFVEEQRQKEKEFIANALKGAQ